MVIHPLRRSGHRGHCRAGNAHVHVCERGWPRLEIAAIDRSIADKSCTILRLAAACVPDFPAVDQLCTGRKPGRQVSVTLLAAVMGRDGLPRGLEAAVPRSTARCHVMPWAGSVDPGKKQSAIDADSRYNHCRT